MIQLIRTIRKYLPPRRRRFWKYVSPRRRGVGVAVLAMLFVALYGYWHLTNDRRICREAERYLGNLTGMRVNIHKAHFSIFGGIQLQRVRVYIPGDDSPKPFFQANAVVLKARPWELLWSRKLRPTEIICQEPIVTIEYSRQDGYRFGARGLLQLVKTRRQRDLDKWRDALPHIRVSNGRLRVVNVEPGAPAVTEEQVLNAFLIPRGAQVYSISFEEERPDGQAVIHGSMLLDLKTGEITGLTGELPIVRLGKVLPPAHRKWLLRYGIKGKLEYRGRASLGDGSGAITAELKDVSLKLPHAEGGLDCVHVNGTLAFDEKEVRFLSITGQIPQAGGAKFRLSGRYSGYEVDSPFEIRLHIDGMSLPAGGQTTGGLAEALDYLHSTYQPRGSMDLDANFERLETGGVLFSGTVAPRAMSLTAAAFPYRLDDVVGDIEFSSDRVRIKNLTAKRGQTRFRIGGKMDVSGTGAYELTVLAEDVRLDEHFRKALPEEYVAVYRELKPSGRAAALVTMTRAGRDQPEHLRMELRFDGHTAFTYRRFPYPLEGVVGKIFVEDDNITIQNVQCVRRKGDSTPRCVLRGTIEGLSRDRPDVELVIEAENVPLDDVLASALDPQSRKALQSFHAVGVAKKIKAHISQSASQPLEHDVRLELEGVEFTADAFPCKISDASGSLRIQPELIRVDGIRGRHKNGPITITGCFYPSGDEFSPDLRIEAENMLLDEELFGSLPADIQDVWRRLSPAGSADVDLAFRYDAPGQPKGLDYELALLPRDMQVRYERFPYKFRCVGGEALVTPGKIVLDGIRLAAGEMRASISGVMLTGQSRERADLAVKAVNVSLDEEFLSALPGEILPLVRRLAPGGTCEVDLTKLCIEAGPATQPAQNGAPVTWEVTGAAAVKDAVMDIGFGPKKFSGGVSGRAARTEQGIAIAADMKLSDVEIQQRPISELQGRLLKEAPSALIRIDDLIGKAHGGRLSGSAEIRLADPLQYGISLVVEDIQLEQLFPRAVGDAAEGAQVKGLLGGSVQFTAIGNDPATRQAYGTLTISQAKLYKLPIMIGLLHVIYMSLPGDAAFTHGGIIYHLRGEQLVLQEIYLSGSAISITGSGAMDMKTEALKLHFLTGPPGKVPRLSGLAAGGLLRNITRELMEIQVRGTLSKPLTRTVPLRSVDSAIQTLLSPGKE